MFRFLAPFAVLAMALPALSQPAEWQRAWPDTDFARSNVDFDEVFSGGPPKDGIPAVDDPSFVPLAQGGIPDAEPVMTVEIDGHPPRAYPLRYLMWHEIVNDQIGDVPIAVTWCPLCNSGLVFDRRLDGALLDFGVSGLLRHSDMIMYDRQTESWWQQFTGEGIVGHYMGRRLDQVISWTESMGTFSARNPDGLVMAQPGAGRNYGLNPYRGYDSSLRPFLYRGENPPHGIHPLAHVVRVGNRAWPLVRIADRAELVEDGVRIVWQGGMASALDSAQISDGRDIGQIRVFDAVTGASVLHEVVFAFAFHAFEPQGRWMLGN